MLRQEFATPRGEISATTILVTHGPADAALLADRIGVLADAKMVQTARGPQISRPPASETVAQPAER